MGDTMIDVGSARLATTDLRPDGEAVGTVVALHAGVTDRRAWACCASRWREAGWRVVTYDRRGFGASEWDASAFDTRDDLVAVLDDRGIERAVLVGNSMGGALAIDLALARPERVAGLVLVCSAVSGQTELLAAPTEAERHLASLMETAERDDDLAEVNRIECHYWLDGPEAPEGRVAGAPRSLFLEMNGRALSAPEVGDWTNPPPAWGRLDEISAPTLVIVGLLDETDTVAVGRRTASSVPGAEIVELADSAHLPMLDAPERFCEVVEPFLDRCAER